MFCERCQANPATVHMTKIINGNKTELNLCAECAHEEQAVNFGFEPQVFFPNIFADLFESPDLGKAIPARVAPRCENCGFTHDQFGQTGLLGCSECYTTFEPQLEPVLRRLHAANRHRGKVPLRSGGALKARKESEELKNALQQAVAREDFEKAAELRDRIRAMDKERGEQHGL